ncbi:hypothetical protein Q8G07_29265, partial [Klebsiella pneumoniae]|nr:hypothetical protein [Klebsiella pneumoniae]
AVLAAGMGGTGRGGPGGRRHPRPSGGGEQRGQPGPRLAAARGGGGAQGGGGAPRLQGGGVDCLFFTS